MKTLKQILYNVSKKTPFFSLRSLSKWPFSSGKSNFEEKHNTDVRLFKQALYIITIPLIVLSCASEPATVEQESNLIEITEQQFTTEAMQVGKIERQIFEKTIKCNGSIVPLPNGKAKISTPLPGVVKDVYCHNGQFVEKNQTLLMVSGNQIIDIQKDYAEASANYNRLKNEYDRVSLLYNERVIPEKEYIITKGDYEISRANYIALKLKIEALNLSIAKIENGNFYASYPIKSPISGYISNLKANIGSYIDQQSALIDITDPSMFQVELSVFSADIAKLKKGQTVRFKPVNSENPHLAVITSLGVAISDESKSIYCYAALSDKITKPIANEFIESEIILSTDTVNALPAEAIINSDSKYFILALNKKEDAKYYFDKIEVNIGQQYNGYTEIINPKIDGLVALKGVYNIQL
ncbi:efflux RND transporter periplasmic adaptor subunit [Geofilum sp. OHC36d9]|uniref:efflux RND transporter periplasmic adaptor subunit n=1 Tax=Geofilum sp. OHC36d9 TaxID=3458413 RepID=UPI0040336D0D